MRGAASLNSKPSEHQSQSGFCARPVNFTVPFHDIAQLTARALRRKLGLEELQQIHHQLAASLGEASTLLEPDQAEKMGSSDAQTEQHYQNSIKDSYESEQGVKPAHASDTESKDDAGYAENPPAGRSVTRETPPPSPKAPAPSGPSLSLRLILSSCGEIHGYADGPVRHWPDLLRAADTVRPMMGISSAVQEEAKRATGAAEASVVISAMLERFGEIRCPSAYLRHLSAKATSGHFSSGPMVMALARQEAA
ncbi:plasmid replication protein RepC [Leisingera methylohalidivorans]|uniref:Plasmid replication protein C C-terminal domain-containing protein n=1 Tax=Leisingera methylohalidivorans DSM 14336 TaxID=999552 RepID=V9W081_9RHOB|nr:plasmid replication protein RepC [Leisingera methylohalidivorans]AHD03583.1 hypothetical protein METH_22405 [Leisingera methylohalidivorans DSM 14336]